MSTTAGTQHQCYEVHTQAMLTSQCTCVEKLLNTQRRLIFSRTISSYFLYFSDTDTIGCITAKNVY